MMANDDGKHMIVGLDIGTSKVVAVVGRIDPDGGIEVVGIGSIPSRGMKKGVVGQYRIYGERYSESGRRRPS
jgi:cell division protein FtsA